MKLIIVGSTENKVEEAERLLGRELTPQERGWLMLSDQCIGGAEKYPLSPRDRLRAA
jgi:hypothetical protein